MNAWPEDDNASLTGEPFADWETTKKKSSTVFTTPDEILGQLNRKSVFELARLADTYDPDNAHSAGAQFLQSVREAIAEGIRDALTDNANADALNALTDNGTVSEIADSAVPVYTHETWATFTDLGAWDVDTEGMEAEDADMTQRANVALFIIGDRLANALIDETREMLDDEDA